MQETSFVQRSARNVGLEGNMGGHWGLQLCLTCKKCSGLNRVADDR